VEALGRYRLVIDFPAPTDAEAEYVGTLAYIHTKAILRNLQGIDPSDVTLHGVRELGGDAGAGGGGR
jgi:hypothetical protein